MCRKRNGRLQQCITLLAAGKRELPRKLRVNRSPQKSWFQYDRTGGDDIDRHTGQCLQYALIVRAAGRPCLFTPKNQTGPAWFHQISSTFSSRQLLPAELRDHPTAVKPRRDLPLSGHPETSSVRQTRRGSAGTRRTATVSNIVRRRRP